MINGKTDNIKIDGHIGTWYIIDTMFDEDLDEDIYLLEHEVYGDMAASLIVDKNGKIILDNVFNGFEDWEYNKRSGN